MFPCPAASGLDELKGPAARAGGGASRQALDSLEHVVPAAAEVLLPRYVIDHGLDGGRVELLQDELELLCESERRQSVEGGGGLGEQALPDQGAGPADG